MKDDIKDLIELAYQANPVKTDLLVSRIVSKTKASLKNPLHEIKYNYGEIYRDSNFKLKETESFLKVMDCNADVFLLHISSLNVKAS